MKKGWKKGFKVCSINAFERLLSYNTTPDDRAREVIPEHILEYVVGLITKRKENCGPLAVFDKKPNNIFGCGVQLCSCVYLPSEDVGLWRGDISFDNVLIQHDFPNTKYADQVKIIKKIDWSN